MRTFGPLGLAMLLSAGVACSKVRASSSPESAAATYDLPSPTLHTTDIPDFRIEEEGVITNDDLVLRLRKVDDQPERFAEIGRLTGFHRAFRTANTTAPRLPVTITDDLEQYQSPDAAKRRLRTFEPVRDLPVSVEAVTELPPPRGLGQGARSYRMVVHTDRGDRIMHLVLFRRGDLVNIITTNADFHRDDKGEDALRLSRLVDERIHAASPKR